MDTYISVGSLPSFSDFNPAEDATLPTEAQLGIANYLNVDNQTPAVSDPANWFIFDIGDENDPSKPQWMTLSNTGVLAPSLGAAPYGPTNSNNLTPGATFNNVTKHGINCQGFTSGGPRNLGYVEISDSTWWRLNNYVDNSILTNSFTLRNEAWKEGSLEFTIRPDKENCTLASGALFAGDSAAGSLSGIQEPPGKQQTTILVPDGIDNNTRVEVIQEYGVGPGEEKGYAAKYTYLMSGNSGQVIQTPDPASGVNLTDARSTFRLFKVDLVNGLIRVSYEIFYGPNKKYVEFFSKTNIVDGNWHHVVINRPSPFTFKDSEQFYGGEGCFEIWIDGILEQRDFNIKTTDVLPVPQILFNNQLNAGILNWYEYSSIQNNLQWKTDEIARENYVGGIRDYIFRQSIALSPHNISLNHIYAMLNTETSTIYKAKKSTASALMVQPSVTTSKPKILKLYWNNLLKDKTKCKNGIELDESYSVYSYSMTNKNIISPTQTFNLDLNDTTAERKFLTNVKTAVGKHMFIPAPSMVMTSTTEFALTPSQTGFWGEPQMIDTIDDQRILAEAVPSPNYINNMLFGGVILLPGDRVLLFNQNKQNENGIWIFNGGNQTMTRPDDVDVAELLNAHVYVEQGKYAGKTYVQTNTISHIRKSPQTWREVDNEVTLSTISSYPIHTVPWADNFGNERFIDVNTDIDFDYDIIAFMNYPTESKDILDSLQTKNDIETLDQYKIFIENLKTAVTAGKSLMVTSPQLAVDLGIVDKVTYVPQLLETSGDAQSAAISPFESGELAEFYFDTHRNNKYQLTAELLGLTNKETYILTDFVTYSPEQSNSDYHIKYSYRQFGIQEGDEFYIPGLTTLPETLNANLPGYIYNQKGISDLPVFAINDINFGTVITELANTYYNGSTAVSNPYDDYATTIAATYGNGKIFVNCVENGYAFSRLDYNTGRIQTVTPGQNSETVQTAAWQYSTKRLNKQNLYDFSDVTNLIGQTTPTDGGGGGAVQAQSHASNGLIRKQTNKDDLAYQSDLYPDFTEEYFTTTEIPVLSMTWLGLQWLAE
jgi:hypothetical protein